MPVELSNCSELGALKRCREEAGFTVSDLADELKRARQAVHVLEERDRVAPERVRPVSRQRYLEALASLVAKRREALMAIGVQKVAEGIQILELAETNA